MESTIQYETNSPLFRNRLDDHHHPDESHKVHIAYYVAYLNDDGSIQNYQSDKVRLSNDPQLTNDMVQQFRVEMGTEVRFRLRRGCKVSRDAHMLVNKPKISHNDELNFESEEMKTSGITQDTDFITQSDQQFARKAFHPQIDYTVTQPRQRLLEQLNHPAPEMSSLIPSKAENFTSDLIMKPYITTEDEIDQKLLYHGSKLENQYLEPVEAYNREFSVNLEFRIFFPEAGSFFVQLDYFDEDLKDRNFTDPIYINVDPVLILRNEKIRVKELSLLTVISRQMGAIEDHWEDMYCSISQLGYNAIHFAPIQKYGYSMSHYSIADQTLIDDYYFKSEHSYQEDVASLSREDRIRALKSKVDHLKNQYGLLGIIDIVLNHTAGNSEWLLEHPEAAYNTSDCPHLYSAYVLDRTVADFSADYANKRNVNDCPSAPYINNESDIQSALKALLPRLTRLNLHEYFMINQADQLQQARNFINNDLKGKDLIVSFFQKKFERQGLLGTDPYTVINEKFVENRGAYQNQAKLNIPMASAIAYIVSKMNVENSIKLLEGIIIRHNNEWRDKVQGWVKGSMDSFQGELRYQKLERKNNKITADNPLIDRYFRELNNKQNSKVAHNGWIMNGNPLEDFGMTGWHYLRRSIVIWADSVKLRYGNCPADSPYLWEHMSKYVYDMALTFDGFRLDNAHSTPIHVAYYLLQVARSVNPNLFVMAELFTSSSDLDSMFVRKLNINGLIREMQNSTDASQLGRFFHEITCQESVIGQIDQDFEEVNTGERYCILSSKRPHDILYDCTHDNPAPIEKFKTGRVALPQLGVLSLSDLTIASTWGFDQLLNRNISVINEKKIYYAPNQDDILTKDPHSNSKTNKSMIKPTIKEDSIVTPENETLLPHKLKTEFEHEFIFQNGYARNVQLAGCFNGWKPTQNLIRQPNSDIWKMKIMLPIIQGQEKYQFKFVVDGRNWEVSLAHPKCDDGHGNINNELKIPVENNTQIQLNHHYPTPQLDQKQNEKETTFPDIRYARLLLNQVHLECTKNDAQIFLHQQSPDVLVIIRQFNFDYNDDYDAYVSITRHCFYQDGVGDSNYKTEIDLPGLFSEVVFAGYLEMNPQTDYREIDSDKKYIKFANSKLKTYKSLGKFCSIKRTSQNGQGECDRLVFHTMPPSFTCVIKTKRQSQMKEAAKYLNDLHQQQASEIARAVFGTVPLSGFNHLLFRCDQEERDISKQERGTYGLQQYGQFTYAGIVSFMNIIHQLKIKTDMGHELFNNMRDGDWYLDYTKNRLSFMSAEFNLLNNFLIDSYSQIKKLPTTFRPLYGARVIEKVYNAALFELTQVRMKDRFICVNSDDIFVQKLALSVLQMYGRIPSCYFYEHKDTMAAGLPHFSTGYTRSWGRDTFISLKGLYIATGLWEEAKDTIIQFARVIRHGGLIPNLHDRGNNTRFNARDATWFFMQAIKDFYFAQCSALGSSSEAEKFLKKTQIELQFRDQHNQQVHYDKEKWGEKKIMTLLEIMYMIFESHANGIHFREWNAGKAIDDQMRDEGFNVDIQMDRDTGFVFGGNKFNCGTWMDKMGSSDQTGNKGIPATPRDGAPIELTAMLYSSLRFMEELYELGIIDRKGVKLADSELTYKQWADKIQANFERCYWIPQNEAEFSSHIINKQQVNRRGIYKDVYKSTHGYTDYQLRPNLCIAMSYAPDLFNNENAIICIKMVETILMERNCMGIKTLDPSDKNYNGNYVNSDPSRGWNYHQGPEWLWPVGFFLKAKMMFDRYSFREELREDIMSWLVPHQRHISNESSWQGLPELTNAHGKKCEDSCATQAWSIATILDAIKDLHYI